MKFTLALVALVFAAVGAFALYRLSTPGENLVPEPAESHAYVNETYGIAFSYPDGYVLDEGERGNAERGHYGIVLIREEDSQIPENGEGPTAITVDIYQNNLDQMTFAEWLNTNPSNFKLGDGTFASTTVDSAEAITYRWSGLYEGETTALRHKENMVAVSVTWLTPKDQNVAVYRDLLDSFDLR